jgi:hypothetical protein
MVSSILLKKNHAIFLSVKAKKQLFKGTIKLHLAFS